MGAKYGFDWKISNILLITVELSGFGWPERLLEVRLQRLVGNDFMWLIVIQIEFKTA